MKLPNVYVNPINKKIHNYQELSRSSNKESYSLNEINKKINDIFEGKNHVYKSRVSITLKDKVIECVLVGRTNLNLLTLDNQLIKITDILDIKKI